MFENLTKKMASIAKQIRGEARITEKNTTEMLSQIRFALLEADVALPVVKKFLENVKEKAFGESVVDSLTPGQELVNIVNNEIISILEQSQKPFLEIHTPSPKIVLLAGLQGTGKTTTCGKLAFWLKEKRKSKVLLTSCDIYRPAAIEQLKLIAEQASVDFFNTYTEASNVKKITSEAIQYAKKHLYEILIIDTAGRLALDEKMMLEIKDIYQIAQPQETLFVLDAMQGQEAINIAKTFNETIKLTGTVLTKVDGDSRGGAIFSVKAITGNPVKFVGVSEHLNGLEEFEASRFANRILGMGDILSLVEKAKENLEVEKTEKFFSKLKAGSKFTLEDFRNQILQMQKMGGMSSIVKFLPNALKNKTENINLNTLERSTKKQDAIILSMTKLEKIKPEIIKASRKKRIAKGSGSTVQEVNSLLTQFEHAQQMMKKVGGNSFTKMMGNIPSLEPLSKPKQKNKIKKRKNSPKTNAQKKKMKKKRR